METSIAVSFSSKSRARPAGKKWAQVSNAARATVSGPIRTGDPAAATISACSTGTASSSQPGVVTVAQHGHTFEIR